VIQSDSEYPPKQPAMKLMKIFPSFFVLLFIATISYSQNDKLHDSLPPLHTLLESDISKVTTSQQQTAIIVTLQNGTTYTYLRSDWDYQDYYPSTAPALKTAIESLKITFTKAEQMPEFAGGEEAWANYLRAFCHQHFNEVKKHGPIDFTARFVVHIHGQPSNIELVNGGKSKLSALAKECIQNAPAWMPAVQNGHKVPCYMVQKFTLSL